MNKTYRFGIAAVVLGFVLGIGLGLFLGWQVLPVRWHDTDPVDLRLQHKETYILAVADSFVVNGDAQLAQDRLAELTDDQNDWQSVANLVGKIADEKQASGDAATAMRLDDLRQAVALPAPLPITAVTPAVPAAVMNLIYGGLLLIGLALLVLLLSRMLSSRPPAQFIPGSERPLPPDVGGAAPGGLGPRMAAPQALTPRSSAATQSTQPVRPGPAAATPRPSQQPVAPQRPSDTGPQAALAADGGSAGDDLLPWESKAPASPQSLVPDQSTPAFTLEPSASSVLDDEDSWLPEALTDADTEATADQVIEAQTVLPPAEDDEMAEDEILSTIQEALGQRAPMAVAPALPVAPSEVGAPEGQNALARFEAEYVFGHDDYDSSFTIESEQGDFLGEVGMGTSDILAAGEEQKVDAFEVWLYDKRNIRTVSKFLASAYAYDNEHLHAQLGAKGDLVLAEVGKRLVIETESLNLWATVVDLRYQPDEEYPNGVFGYLKVDLSVEQVAPSRQS